MTTTTSRDREAWLTALALRAGRYLSASCTESDEEPVVRLSCGFPATQGRRKVAAAQILAPQHSADDTAELLVSPVVDDAVQVARLVLPLLLCAYTGDYRQGNAWADAVRRAHLDRDTLPEWAYVLLEGLGAYPHAAVTLPPVATQSTRLLKAVCDGNGEHAAFIVRLSARTFDMGAPLCGVCHAAMELN